MSSHAHFPIKAGVPDEPTRTTLTKDARRHKRVLQRLERQARPLTTGAMVVVRHLIQPVIDG
jgi:hypothetical protein